METGNDRDLTIDIAEDGIFAILLNNPSQWYTIIDILNERILTNVGKKKLLWAARILVEEGQAVNQSSIIVKLSESGGIKDIDKFIEEYDRLVNIPEDKSNLSMYAGFIRSEFAKKLANKQIEIVANKINSCSTETEIISSFEDIVDTLRSNTIDTRVTQLGHSIVDKITLGEDIQAEGFTTGFPSLDNKMGGIQVGRVTSFLADPGVGKSAILSILTARWAYDQGIELLHINTEMDEDEVAIRMLATMSGVSSNSIEDGSAMKYVENMNKLSKACGRMKNANNCKFVYMHNVDYEDIFNICLKHIQTYGTKIIVLDYIKPESGAKDDANTYKMLGRYVDRLKNNIANRHNVAVVTAMQTNRRVTSEEIGMNNIGDSYAMARYADNIIAIEELSEIKRALHSDINANIMLHVIKARSGGKRTRAFLRFDQPKMHMVEVV